MTNFERTVIENQEAILNALVVILSKNKEDRSFARVLHELANTCHKIVNHDPTS